MQSSRRSCPRTRAPFSCGSGPGLPLVAPAQSKKMSIKFEEVSLKTHDCWDHTRDAGDSQFADRERGTLSMTDDEPPAGSRWSGKRWSAIFSEERVRLARRSRIGKVPFEVIGTLAPAGVDMNGADQDDQILLPLRTALRRVFNIIYVNNIYVQVRSEQVDASALWVAR